MLDVRCSFVIGNTQKLFPVYGKEKISPISQGRPLLSKNKIKALDDVVRKIIEAPEIGQLKVW